MERNVMVFLSLFLILKYIYALRLVEKWYEFAPSISMNCKESDFEGVSKGGCAIIAATTPIYNFGFAISEGTCMLCRAGGRLGDANIVESIVTGSSYVDECQGRERIDGFGCYEVWMYEATWHEASQNCTAMGKALVALETAEEFDAIKNFLLQNEARYDLRNTGGKIGNFGSGLWLGATDEATEDTFLWMPSGTPVDFTDWDTNQPNNYKEQDCVVYMHNPKNWHDIACDFAIDGFMCEG